MNAMFINKLKPIIEKDVVKFLYANVLYTLSTGLISLLSPFVMRQEAYEQFIYIFQNVMFLCGIFSLGLVPTLLRYYKFDHERYRTYFFLTCLCMVAIILSLGIFMNNPVSQALKIKPASPSESLIIYLSVASQLIFIFNRGMLAADEKYRKMTYEVSIIFILRIAAIVCVYLNPAMTLKNILLAICIVPMVGEWIHFAISVVRMKYELMDRKYFEFLGFSIKIFLTGVIYTTTHRLFVINIKGVDDSLAATVSFASGIIGLITIFNTTFCSYFIGKLDSRNGDGITAYLARIRRFSPIFLSCTVLFVLVLGFVVYIVYPYDALQTAIYCGLTFFFSAVVFWLGLRTLLCKTYNMLNIQLIMNIICCVTVYVILNLMIAINHYLIFCTVNALIIITEFVLARIVEYRIAHSETE